MSKKPKSTKRGRPKKNVDIDFNKLDESFNINQKNEYPPNKIVTKKLASKIEGKDYDMIYRSDKAKVLEVLLNDIKKKQKHIDIIFTESGMILTHSISDKDQVKFECKIFPDKLIEYALVDPKKDIGMKIEIDTLYKFIKHIPKGNEFNFEIYSTGNKRTFRIINKDYLRDSYVDNQIEVNNVISCPTISFKNNKEYDAIVMFEADELAKICKNINLFTKYFNICVYKDKLRIVFEYNKNNITSYFLLYPSKKCVFLKSPSEDIKNRYNLASFFKFTSTYKISNIVKLYISHDQPMIIEYNIGIGTFQIFVESQ